MDVFALDDHTFGRGHGGFKGRGSVGLGEFMEAADVALVGAGVAWVREHEEVEGFLFKSCGIAGGDDCWDPVSV